MTTEELKSEVDKIAEGLQKKFEAFETFTKDYKGSEKGLQEEVDKLKAENEKLKEALAKLKNADEDEEKSRTELQKALQDQIDELTKKADKMNEKGDNVVSIDTQLRKLITKEFVKDARSQAKGRKGTTTFELEMKSPITMNVTQGGTDGQIPLTQREPGINYAPQRRPFVLDYIVNGVAASNDVSWVEKYGEEGEPAFKKELEKFPQRSWKHKVVSTKVKKVPVYAKYSNEALEDVDYFIGEVRRDIVEQLELVIDKEVLKGTSDSDSFSVAGLKGVLEYAQVWDSDGKTVADATTYDVLAVAINQIIEEHHTPNVIFMHPSDVLEMRLSKDKNGNYIMPPFAAANGQTIDNVQIVTNTGMDKGEFLAMDGSKAAALWKRAIELKMFEQNEDDALHDLFTVTGTARLALRVKGTDAKAFVVGDIATAKNWLLYKCSICPTG